MEDEEMRRCERCRWIESEKWTNGCDAMICGNPEAKPVRRVLEVTPEGMSRIGDRRGMLTRAEHCGYYDEVR